MGEFIDRYFRPVESALTACFYRILGQSSVPFDIEEMLKYVEEETVEGDFGGVINWKVKNRVLWWFVWDGINLSKPGTSDPVTFQAHVWGRPGGHNCVFTRSGWQKMYLIRGAAENTLKLKRWSLSLR